MNDAHRALRNSFIMVWLVWFGFSVGYIARISEFRQRKLFNKISCSWKKPSIIRGETPQIWKCFCEKSFFSRIQTSEASAEPQRSRYFESCFGGGADRFRAAAPQWRWSGLP